MIIRKIKPSDNSKIEQIIKSTILEYNLPMTGTAYEDNETENMFQSYQGKKEIYFILEDNGNVVGGGGIKRLKNNKEGVCELQKMYFSPNARGKGYGKILFNKCMKEAKKMGFKQCYLETSAILEAAIHIYQKNKFQHLKGPLDGTGHYSCGVWMLKNLEE